MSYTKQSFEDGQVLTAKQMNDIVAGLSRSWLTSEQCIGTNDPINVRLLPLNEDETYFTGYVTVKITSLTDPITLEDSDNGLHKLNISPIVHAFGDTLLQVIEAKYGLHEFGVIDPQLRIYDVGSIFSEGIYSWGEVKHSSNITKYTTDQALPFRITLYSGYYDIDQSKIDEICKASSTQFTFKINIALT